MRMEKGGQACSGIMIEPGAKSDVPRFVERAIG
jgi:hypothetical protein